MTPAEKIDSLNKKVDDLAQKMDRVLSYLHNDKGTGKPGLVAAFADHENKFNLFLQGYNTKKAILKDRTTWIGTFFGALGSTLFLGLKAGWDYYSRSR